jgi:sterol desaturase/sphingolipid hydroxylase (fatty acid hydroxylase superfamily)
MRQQLLPFVVFWGSGLLAFAGERLFPARDVPYRAVFLRDLGTVIAYSVCFLFVVRFTDRIPIPKYVPASVLQMPLAYKVLLFYIVEDFGLYWVHRFMHTKYVWRTHKWHHYPTYMYWLAGSRTSIPHIALFNLTFVVALPFLAGAPKWIFQAILVEHILRNTWMHMNVTWTSGWLEWIFVTPRYHHVHHSDNPSHYRSNLGSLLTIWDRIFGTYYNPEEVKETLSFGIGERVPAARLLLGI